MKKIFLFCGWILFAFVVYRMGPEPFLRSFTEIGWNYVWIVLWPLVYYLFYSWGWYLIVPPAERQAPFLIMFKARLVGEAVNYLTPLGNLGGEPARTFFLKGHLPLSVTAATVILDRTLYLFSTLFFTLLGIVLAYIYLDLSFHMKLACLCSAGSLLVMLVFLLLAQQIRGLSRLAHLLMRFRWGKSFLENTLPKLESMEQTMRDFYRKRPRDFLGAVVCSLLGRLGGTIEIWLILFFLGAFRADSPWAGTQAWVGYGLTQQAFVSLLIAVFVIVVNFVFFMFPSQIGVAEGSTALLFKMLTMDPALGVAVQIARRVKSVFYIAFGLWLARKSD